MKTRTPLFGIIVLSIFLLTGCNKDEGFNIFSVNDDIALGQQIRDTIAADPTNYPLLKESQYPEAYNHIRRIRDSILSTGIVDYDDVFEWQVFIIKDDETLNAFCTPGGYIYFFTGIIKFLDDESQFAGVLAHEMVHAAKRHSTEQLTNAYGMSLLLSIVLGNNPAVLAQIAAELAAGVTTLAFSRKAEYEADEYAVKYLYQTSYHPLGVAGFFEKLEGEPQPPVFLSTHPSPENRIEKINEAWQSLGGKAGNTYEASYQDFKNSLP